MVKSTQQLCVLMMLVMMFCFVGADLSVAQALTNNQPTLINVSGQVTSPQEGFLGGATISYENRETSADVNGRFVLQLTAPGDVVFSAVGHASTTIRISRDTTVTVTLAAEGSELDEVVVIGYGSVRRRDLTGAVSSVKAEEIAMAPVANPIEALQGRIAGVDIARQSGTARSESSILLRGNRSLIAGSEPLYIIDGIPGSITNLNPADIESIDVLKDAASTAIYGSAGANGVFIITTKQAEAGRVEVSLDAFLGINSNGRYPAARQQDAWLTYLEDSFIATNDRRPTDRDELLTAWSLNPEQINRYINQGQWIDWVDETLRTGIQQNYMVSVNGGTERTQGFFTMGYNSTQGIYRNDQSDLYTVRGGAQNKINDWFTGGINTGLTWRDNEMRPSRLNNTFGIPPVGEVYDAHGNINVYPIEGLMEPSLLADDIPNTLRQNSKNLVVTINPYVDLDIAKGLTFRSIMGATLGSSRNGNFASDRTYAILSGSGAEVRTASYATSLTYNYIWENIATYQTKFGSDHDLTTTLVSSWASNQREEALATSQGFLYDEFQFYSLQGGTIPGVTSGYRMSKRMSVAARLNYAYKGRYLLTLTNRTDGVSQLARRWDNFIAAAAAWRISDEAFMENTRDVVSNLKLRASYGVSGNSGIDPYSTLTEVTGAGLDMINLGGGLLPASVLTQTVGNPLLGWEKSYNLNFGLDVGLFNNRIDATLEFYDTDTRDVLYLRNLPFSSGGFTPKEPYTIMGNIARMRNRGVELTLNARILDNRPFRWNSTLTYAYNDERIRSIDLGSGTTVDDLISLGLFLDKPANVLFGHRKLGIWQLGQEADAAVFGLRPGDVRIENNLTHVEEGLWVDYTGENPIEYSADNPYTISPEDRVVIGQESPLWTAGWQNSFFWKGIDLNIFTIARWGHFIDSEMLGHFRYRNLNVPSTFNYWTPDNPTNDYPRPYINRTVNHSQPVQGLNEVDGSFIKIKNITLGYTLPEHVGRRLGMSRYRVYATMFNPIIFTRSHLLRGLDPETGAGDSFPLYRQMVFGVNLSF